MKIRLQSLDLLSFIKINKSIKIQNNSKKMMKRFKIFLQNLFKK